MKYSNIKGIAFLGILLVGMLGSILLPDAELSYDERRKLAQLPDFSLSEVLDGDYMADLDTYLLDQFIGRDVFRTLKAEFDKVVLQKEDSNGYYIEAGSIFQIQTTTNLNYVKRAGDAFYSIAEAYFPEANIYYSVIPDKNYFVSDIPSFDYEGMLEVMEESMMDTQYIDLFEVLSIEDYYATDLHWKQESLLPVARALLEQMGITLTQNYDNILASDSFLGGYGASSAYNVDQDSLIYLSGDMLDDVTVYDYELQQYVDLYQLDKVDGMDGYDLYLGGAKPLLTITNENSTTDRTLLLFRDSFGSSIAPLLIEGFSEITIIDLRYVTFDYAMRLLGEKEYTDVMFLYHVMLLHNSNSMKL